MSQINNLSDIPASFLSSRPSISFDYNENEEFSPSFVSLSWYNSKGCITSKLTPTKNEERKILLTQNDAIQEVKTVLGSESKASSPTQPTEKQDSETCKTEECNTVHDVHAEQINPLIQRPDIGEQKADQRIENASNEGATTNDDNSSNKTDDKSDSSTDESAEPEWHSIDGGVFHGCKHYLRECKICCEECQRFFPCRICHDKIADHEIDRYKINKVWCYKCKKIGPFQRQCAHCGIEFATYFCDKCKFLNGNPLMKIFHCDKCGFCRVGTREEVIHCDGCNVCLFAATAAGHKCIPDAMKKNCPVCFKDLFSTRHPSWRAPCGHYMHLKCVNEMFNAGIVHCPICRKLMVSEESIVHKQDEEFDLEPAIEIEFEDEDESEDEDNEDEDGEDEDGEDANIGN